jgi:hypothetical protein
MAAMTDITVTPHGAAWDARRPDGYRLAIQPVERWRVGVYKAEVTAYHHDQPLLTATIDLAKLYDRQQFQLSAAAVNGQAPVSWDQFLERCCRSIVLQQASSPHEAGAGLSAPETLTELLGASIPAPAQLFEGLMHEGMLLLGGKSKRGKSWLMFDLAIALAVQNAAFRHFPCPRSMPVLYLALEDGRARLQNRAKLIKPGLATADQFHLRYTFPPLSEGGIEILAREIEQYHYGLVVIDVLARLEKSGAKGEKNYHEVYEMFAPLQELRKQHPFCLAMLTHLRKQDAEDVFDSLHGSVAYQGAQDVLWVLERKPKDDFAFLHVRDKDADDQTIALRFVDGHWEYVGEGEEYEISRDERKVLRVLAEEGREMGIPEILRAAGFPEARYAYVRKLLAAMVKNDLIHRTQHGKYSATVSAAYAMAAEEGEETF